MNDDVLLSSLGLRRGDLHSSSKLWLGKMPPKGAKARVVPVDHALRAIWHVIEHPQGP